MTHLSPQSRLGILLAFGLAVLAPREASACSCVQVSPAMAFEEHAAVFEGRVVETRVQDGVQIAILAIVQHWKGVDAEQVEVRTPTEESMCGVAFRAETSWLIYADAADGHLSTGLCSRTRLIEEAEEDLAFLGAGVVPVDIGPDDEVEPPAEDEPPTSAGCASCAIVRDETPSPVLAGFVLAFFAWRRLSSCRSRSRRSAASPLRRTVAGTRCAP